VAYFLGSTPTGYLVARARGTDIRRLGSGNIGATNVFRTLGKPAGSLVLLADLFKGFLACLAAPQVVLWLGWVSPSASSELEKLSLVAGIFAILGHNYTCWLRFRGGKGIATSAGALFALVPIATVLSLLTWAVFATLFRYVSLASIAAALVLPIAVWATGYSFPLILVTTGMALMAILKHRSNIQRLIAGTESRIGAKPKDTRA